MSSRYWARLLASFRIAEVMVRVWMDVRLAMTRPEH